MTADWGVVGSGPNLVVDLLSTLGWLVISVGALWTHAAHWLTDGPLGRRLRDETTRMFVLEIPHGVAGAIGFAGVPAGAFMTSVLVLDLVGVEPSIAATATVGLSAAGLTFLVWRSGRNHRWMLPTAGARTEAPQR